MSIERDWNLRTHDGEIIANLQSALNCPQPFAAVLANRGYTDPATAQSHLSPGLDALHPPRGLPDIDAAVHRLQRACEQGERIRVYADRDVDGGCGGALMVRLLESYGATVDHDGPGKYDGFGFHDDAIDDLLAADSDLLVTVDCGTTAHDQLRRAKEAGIDVIVTDHHNPEEALPPSLACVNPRRQDSEYPNPNLAGGGVAYKVGAALIETIAPADHEVYRKYALPLAAVSTLGDYMALNRENRAIVRTGFERLFDSPLPGLREVAQHRGVQSMQDVSWSLTSFLNSAQEDEEGGLLVELLLADNSDRIALILETLETYHEQRREDRRERQAHLEECFEAQVDAEATDLYFVETDRYVGGVAMSRLSESWGRPVIAYRRTNGEYKGGGRSDPDVDFLELFSASEEHLEEYWGHPGAAGFRVAAENRDAFERTVRKALAERYEPADLRPTIDIDARIISADIDGELLDALDLLRPFGPSNQEPRFLLERVTVESFARFGEDDRHVKLRPVEAEDIHFIHWDGAEVICEIDHPAIYDFVGTVDYDAYEGRPAVTIEDFRVEAQKR